MHMLKQILQFGEKIIVTATFVIVIIIAIVFILNGSRVKTHLFQLSHYFIYQAVLNPDDVHHDMICLTQSRISGVAPITNSCPRPADLKQPLRQGLGL